MWSETRHDDRAGDAAGRPFLDGVVAAVAEEDVAQVVRCDIHGVDQAGGDERGGGRGGGDVTRPGLRHKERYSIDGNGSCSRRSRIFVVGEQNVSATGAAHKG